MQDKLEDFQLKELMDLPEDILVGAFLVDRPPISRLMRAEQELDNEEPESDQIAA